MNNIIPVSERFKLDEEVYVGVPPQKCFVSQDNGTSTIAIYATPSDDRYYQALVPRSEIVTPSQLAVTTALSDQLV